MGSRIRFWLLSSVGMALLAVSATLNAQSLMKTTQSLFPAGPAINRGDFNNDGILDIITPNFILLGRADGTFAPPIQIDNAQISANSDLAVGDFNGDGNLDVVIVDEFSLGVRLLFGNGDGTFRLGELIAVNGGAISIGAGDFNNDGKLDLAVANGVPEIEILEGDGRGHFSPANTLKLGASINSFLIKVRIGDFNKDGKVDLAVLQQETVSAWFGNGNFTFDQVVLNHYAQASDLSTSDVNQDGFTDVLVSFDVSPAGAKSSGNICCPQPFNNGVDGYFGQPSRSLRPQHLISPSNNTDETARLIIAADVDGDGINDLVSLGLDMLGRSSVFVWKGNGDGTFQQVPAVQFTISGEAGGVSLISGDFNRDGKPDLVVTDISASLLHVFLNATPRALCVKSTANRSVTVCQPQEATFSNSPLHVVAKTTSINHVTGVNVYVDNFLRSRFVGSSIDQRLSLPNGNHFVVVKAFDTSGASFRSDRHVTIFNGAPGQTCPTSSQAPSVHICIPASDSGLRSPVQVLANSYSADIITAIQVYIDGNLEFNDSSMTTWINKQFALGTGMHLLVVKAFDAAGHQIADSRTIEVREAH